MDANTPVISSALQQLYDEIYRRVVEDQLDPICRFQADYRLTFVNQPYAALYDKRPAELIGQTMLEVIPSAYRPQVIAHLASLSPQHPTAVDENPVYLADGSLHWFHWTNRLIELADGTIEYQGVGRDITARKQTEDAEREQRLYAEAMRDSLVALTSSLDVEQVMTQILASAAAVVPSEAGSIILVENGYGRVAYCRAFGPEATAVLQQTPFPIDSVPNVRNAFAHKVPYIALDTHRVEEWFTFPVTEWIRSSIGVPIECEERMVGLLVADSATPNHFEPGDVDRLKTFALYAGLALTNAYQAAKLEQRVAERTAELQAAKEQVEAILNHSSHAITLIQPDLHIVQSNAVFGQLFPTYLADTPGQSLLAFVHPEDHVIVQEGVARVLRTGGNHYLQIRAGGDKDRYFEAELSIGSMDNAGFVCTLHDITERKARERQLLYYASIQESVNEAVIVVDLDYRIQSWNKAAETIFGWRAAEVIGQTTTAIFRTLYSSEENREVLRQNILEQGYWQGEVIQHGKDGTPQNIAASITLLRDVQGVPFGMVGILRDITEQRQTELALKENRYFTEQIVAIAPTIIYVYDLLTQRNTYINHNITTMLGYSVEEFSTMGQRIVSEVVHPDDVGLFLAHIKRLDTGKDGEVFTLEHRMRHKNGQWRWFLMQATIFQRAADGVPTQTLGVAIDITERKQATEALQQQHDFLQAVIDHVPGVIAVKNRQGQFQLANQYTAQLYGATPAMLVGKTTREINPNQQEVNAIRQLTDTVFTTQQAIFLPEALLGERYYQATLIPVLGLTNEDDQVLIVAFDITARKQAEAARDENRYLVQQIANLAPNLIYLYDVQTQRVIYMNRDIATVLGYSPTEPSPLVEQLINEMMHPADVPQYRVEYQQMTTAQEGEILSFEFRMRHKNGQWRWFLSQHTIFQHAADGTASQVLGVAIDITERKQAAEALQQQRDFLQVVIDHIPSVIAVMHRTGRYQLANQYMAQLLGTTPQALIGKLDIEVNPTQVETNTFRQLVGEVLTSKQPLFMPEIEFHNQYYQVNLIPLINSTEEDDQMLIVGTEITERKQAEIALQQALQTERELSELKSGFITTTSHEFRTPLTIILSITETLRAYRHKLPPEQIEQRLDRIAGQVQYLKKLMEDVFDLSRMQARRVDFTPVHANPATLFLALVNEFQDQTETTRHLHYTAAEGLPMANLDERLLRQILYNLLANAIKYSAADKPIAIHLACADDALVLTVRDEGIGIPAADRKHLFLPFYRATNIGTIPGTGLGLSITKEAVELHGGSIMVESQVGVGTTFTVTFPVAARSHSAES